MEEEIRVLLLEVMAQDADLIERELSRAGVNFSSRRAGSQEACLQEFTSFRADLILADCSDPQFNALEVFRLLRKRNVDIPFLLVTDSGSEDIALQAVGEGVDDYVLKSSLRRLPFAVMKTLERRRSGTGYAETHAGPKPEQQATRFIIENAQDLICLVDQKGCFVYASPSFRQVLGYKPHELIGREYFSLVHVEERDAVRQEFHEAAQRKSSRQVEHRYQQENGEWLTLESLISWTYDKRGHPHEAVMVARNLTERKRLEEQLRQSQKMEVVSRLTSSVAHDFNNLLTAILGYSELLLSHLSTESQEYGEVVQIQKAAERATVLTRQLLTYGRKQRPQPKVLDLNELIAALDGVLKELIGERIELITILEPELGKVKMDAGQVEQVLMGLAANARDAMTGGGELIIETANEDPDASPSATRASIQSGPYVMLSVSDTGCGMSDETKSRLFEPFFTTKERGRASGLGLFTIYGIVKQSEGHIWVTSKPGRGTTVRIYLPRIEKANEAFSSRSG